MLNQIEHITTVLSEFIWPLFLPILLVLALYVGLKMNFIVKDKITSKNKVSLKNLIGPTSISLGAMIGTGAIIGVLGSLSKLNGQGQMYIESMALWAVLGSLLLVPLSYSETIVSKVMNSPPQEYLKVLISPLAGKIYGIAFIILYIFGFGGFQFSGMDTAITIINSKYFNIFLGETQRYLFIVIPIIIFVSSIVLTKKHNVFINFMTYMISISVVLYFVFFSIFIVKTSDYFPIFFERMLMGLKNPVSMMIGIPTGLILGLQRIIQTAETGLGALGMASLVSKSKPREAGIIALIPTVITIFVAIIVTTYITSYGLEYNLIDLNGSGSERLAGFFNTGVNVAGNFGLIVLLTFTILSGLTTLLGSYYFLSTVLEIKVNAQIIVYILLITIAGTLAVYGFTIVFDIVDLLLFVVTGINAVGLSIFVSKKYKEYIERSI